MTRIEQRWITCQQWGKKQQTWQITNIINIWLVVYLLLWKIWVRQLGWWNSQYCIWKKWSKPPTRHHHQKKEIHIINIAKLTHHQKWKCDWKRGNHWDIKVELSKQYGAGFSLSTHLKDWGSNPIQFQCEWFISNWDYLYNVRPPATIAFSWWT